MQAYNIAVVGATGAVGEVILSILAERNFPVEELYALASERSAGDTVMFNDKPVLVENLADFDFSKVQIALFSAGGSISEQYAPIAADAGCVVIDNTSHFRYDDDIPLIIPEVNPEAIAGYLNRNIIANPNCSTIQMLVALKPIHDEVGVKSINVATYQAVSGSGRKAIKELAGQTAKLLNGMPPETEVYAKQIAFNVLPQIDEFMENGYTKEEMKMVWETHKIFGDDRIAVNPTCVRVPVFFGHSEAVHIETHVPLDAEEARSLLENFPGITVVDERQTGSYATPVTDSAGSDEVWVSRLRNDVTNPNGLNLWVVSDNVRKGAALNSVQIAELLVENYI
jgi:aspartate-semialdehyde dehydrogenase